MPMYVSRRRPTIPAWAILLIAFTLAACGGGGDGAAGGAPDDGGSPTPGPAPTLLVTDLQLAQTHIIPAQGKSITGSDGETLELKMVGQRAALALIELSPAEVSAVQLEGRLGAQSFGSVPLQGNDALPATESGGTRLSDTAMVADIPAHWMRPGLELRVNAASANPSGWIAVNVGINSDFTLRVLPYYLFGADEDLVPFAAASRPPEDARDEIFAKWAITTLDARNHPARRIDWPTLVIPPRNGNAAYVMDSAEDRLSGFDPIAAVRTSLAALRHANGESGTANQYYGALIQANADGSFSPAGGGIGGGHVGAGDESYQGIFIHEQGHAFGLPHAGESFDASSGYPYIGGSLRGSAPSFDQIERVIQPITVPSNASRFASCASDNFNGTPRQVDDTGACIRQDPMQSGSGDQAAGERYTTFADYHAARMQRYFEGFTTVASDGGREYSGGRVFDDEASATGYSRWDTLDRVFVAFDPTDDPDNAIDGVHRNYPVATQVPVYSIVATRSHANTPGATQIYPVIGPWTGNMVRIFDPTSPADRDAMRPNTGPNAWYCRNRGCDFSFRLTYAGGLVRHFVIPVGFRRFFTNNDDAPLPEASVASDSFSFRTIVMNVPADLPLQRVELLDTPRAFDGIAAAPPVLASRLASEP